MKSDAFAVCPHCRTPVAITLPTGALDLGSPILVHCSNKQCRCTFVAAEDLGQHTVESYRIEGFNGEPDANSSPVAESR